MMSKMDQRFCRLDHHDDFGGKRESERRGGDG